MNALQQALHQSLQAVQAENSALIHSEITEFCTVTNFTAAG